MKRYKDQHGVPWEFEESDSPDFIAAVASRNGVTLTAITDVEYGTIINPPKSLADIQKAKIAELEAAYAAEITGDVEYNGAIYQGGQRSLDALLSRLRIGTDPSHWRAKDNSNTVPFTLGDVDALRGMIEIRAANAVDKLHLKKDAVLRDGVTAEEVQSVTW